MSIRKLFAAFMGFLLLVSLGNFSLNYYVQIILTRMTTR